MNAVIIDTYADHMSSNGVSSYVSSHSRFPIIQLLYNQTILLTVSEGPRLDTSLYIQHVYNLTPHLFRRNHISPHQTRNKRGSTVPLDDVVECCVSTHQIIWLAVGYNLTIGVPAQ